MGEENEELTVIEEPKEEEQTSENKPLDRQSKSALIAFILAVGGFINGFAWLFAITGVVLGIVALGQLKDNNPETEVQPYRTFGRIAKPVAIVDIVFGAIMFVVYLVIFIVNIVQGVTQ